ncbi:MAG: glycosyltransferase family 2 protein [Candidatus Bathyarchaeia archaeon]
MGKRASIVIPVHNEEVTIFQNIPVLIEFLQERLTDFEVVLVENGSTDKSREEAERLAQEFERVRTISLPDPCLGNALKKGFLSSKFEKTVYFPADLSTDLCFITDSLSLLDDYDVVVGSKRADPSSDERTILRRLSSKLYHRLVSGFLGLWLTDTTCVKAFRREVIMGLINSAPSVSHIYETELLAEAVRRGYRIIEIPVRVFNNRRSRESLMFKAYTKLRDLLSLNLDVLSIYFGLILSISGLTALAIFSTSKLLPLNQLQVDPHIIMYSIIIAIFGIQSIAIGLLANLFLQIRREFINNSTRD